MPHIELHSRPTVLRVGVVGTGFGASAQIPGFRAAGCEVTVVCSARPERAREAARRQQVPNWVTDAAELARREDVDLVSIASPPHLHHEHVLAAVAAGKHVLCEKPFALDAGQARAMLDAAEAARLVHAIDHEFRYVPARATLKELIAEGALGEVRALHIVDFAPTMAEPELARQEWWLRRDRGGGILGAIGSHWIDTLRWWCGEVRYVSAQLGTFVRKRPVRGGGRIHVSADDTAHVLLRFASGTLASIQLSVVARHSSRRVMVYGSDASAVIGGNGRLLFAEAGKELQEIVAEPGGDVAEGPGRGAPRYILEAFAALAARVRAHVEDGPRGEHGAEHPTFHDGLRVQEVLDAAYASSEAAGSAVEIAAS